MAAGAEPSASALVATARSLAVDGVTAEVARAFRDRGIPLILLKGPTLATWLYDDGTSRFYLDSDLWVAPPSFEAAERALSELGFERRPLAVEPPKGKQPHAEPWHRAEDRAEVDLHRTLSGVGVAPEEAWKVLAHQAEEMMVGGEAVAVLPIPARALLVALHASQHGPDIPKPLEDLARLLRRFTLEEWIAVAQLATLLAATPGLASGLRLLPAGAEVAGRLGLVSNELIESAIGKGATARVALGLHRLAEIPTLRDRIRLLAREFVPSADFLRWWSPIARRGRLGLAAAYVWRPLWLLWHAIPSLVRWRRSRASRLPGAASGAADLVVMTDIYPELSETFVLTEAIALREAGYRLRIEAGARSRIPNPDAESREIDVTYVGGDDQKRRVGDLAWLLARHPLRCVLDQVGRLRWRREEEVRSLGVLAPVARRLARGGERVIHVHFAGTAALDALRLSRLLDVPYSLTAHAYDIFKRPRNLREKLERAAFVTTGCRYNVDHLRALVAPEHRARIHEVVMGVEADRFRREKPYPAGAHVLAVGRLIEKKGFVHLIDAAALLARDGVIERVTIVGEGPLRAELEERARERGVADVVDLVGAQAPTEVRERLEEAALLAMPCVVARDGDRDSMPVVVKEALAMEVPVVASAEVGLPELIRDEWGRLVPPGDAGALAAAIAALLALSREQRLEMGRAGRAWVLEHCSAAREAQKLSRLLSAAAGSP